MTLTSLYPVCVLLVCLNLHAETGAWLRYAPPTGADLGRYRAALPAVVVAYGSSLVTGSAQRELIRGIRGMLGRTLRMESGTPAESAIMLGTLADLRNNVNIEPINIDRDGYWLTTVQSNGVTHTVITGSNDRGVLYGVF